MIYYRIAVQTRRSPTWRWMTTRLTSLHVVLNYLQTYRCPAYAQLRIFFASSEGTLEDMLAAENRGDASFSVTPEHLLSRGQPELLAEGPSAEAQVPARQQTLTLTASADALNGLEAPAMPLAMGSLTLMEARRLELELGAGGDHDLPYRFAFPRRLPETCAWIRLREHVQRGDLEP
jgi:hypothetical protein